MQHFLRKLPTLLASVTLTGSFWIVPARAAGDAPVVVIMLENKSFGPYDPGVNGDTAKYIVGNVADAPYINNTLIPAGTLFSNYHARNSVSLPNYLEITAGTNGGCTTDSCATASVTADNVFHLLGESGISFDSYAESMPGNCTTTNSGLYLVHHTAEPYFSNLMGAAQPAYGCASTDLPFTGTWPDPLPRFSFVTPNKCHDMHGTSSGGVCPSNTDAIVAAGDAWLQNNVPTLLSEGAIVIVTFDEGTSGDELGGGGHVATIMVGPGVAQGTSDDAAYDHDGLTAGLEDYFGLTPLLGAAATAPPVPIPRVTPYPSPVITGFTPANGTSGEAVTITGADLTNAYAVRFNGSEATFEDVSDTTIIASVPPGASTGPISVSGRGGTATTGDSFTVVLEGQLPSLAQHTLATGKNAKPSASWPAATSDGDLLVAGIGWSGNGVLTAPPGWTLAAQMGSTQIYFVQGAASQSGTITFSLSARGSWVLGLMEWTGVAPIGALDRQATNTSKGTSGTLADSGTTPATSQAVEVDVAVLHALKGVSQAGPTNGFSQVDEASVGSGNTTGLYAKTPTVIGSQEVSASLSAPSKWRGAIATFKAA